MPERDIDDSESLGRKPSIYKKKIIILLVVLLVVVMGTALFFTMEVPQRLRYSLDGMVNFGEDDYEISDADIGKACSFVVSGDSVGAGDLTVMEFAGGTKLVLKEVTRDEFGYILTIQSVGVSSFEGGQIVVLADGPDRAIETESGSITLAKKGSDGIVKDASLYYYYLYPDQSIPAEEFDKLVIPVTIEAEDMNMRSFSRR